jgi:hypothetical protein
MSTAAAADAVQNAPAVAAPKRNSTRLCRILRAPGKDKPEPRAWRGEIAHNATLSAYTFEDPAIVSSAFVTNAIKDLTDDEVNRAKLGHEPLSAEDQAIAARAARFGGPVNTSENGKASVVPVEGSVDELTAAKRLARFGAVPQQSAQPAAAVSGKNNANANRKNEKQGQKQDKAKKEQRNGNDNKNGGAGKKNAEKKDAPPVLVSSPVDDATKAAMAARAARFGAKTA